LRSSADAQQRSSKILKNVHDEKLYWEINCCHWENGVFIGNPKWGFGISDQNEMIAGVPLTEYGYSRTMLPGETVDFGRDSDKIYNILPAVLDVIKNGRQTTTGLFAFRDRNPANWQCAGFYIGLLSLGPVEVSAYITNTDLQYETWPPCTPQPSCP
jgi:hypothetical protein